MPRLEWDAETADLEAEAAEDELDGIDPNAIQAIAQWWAKHYLIAGHKRLGRVLIAKARMGVVK